MVANPSVTAGAGNETFEGAEVMTGAERDRLYTRQGELMPGFGEYRQKTMRTMPMIALNRKG